MILTLKLKLLCSVLCSYAISKNSFAITTRFQYQKTCNVIGGDLKNLTKTFVVGFSVQSYQNKIQSPMQYYRLDHRKCLKNFSSRCTARQCSGALTYRLAGAVWHCTEVWANRASTEMRNIGALLSSTRQPAAWCTTTLPCTELIQFRRQYSSPYEPLYFFIRIN